MSSRVVLLVSIALGLSVAAGTCWATAPAHAASAPAAAASRAAKVAARPPAPVDLNSASRAQLKTVPGIGDAEAERIIAGRPYLTKADLVTAKVLPAGIYLQIKNRVIALPDPKRPLPAQSKP